MTLTLLSNLLGAEPLEIGSPAPSVQTKDHTGTALDLGEALKEGTVLVFFYPKAMTPGCTKQACSLRDSWDELQSRDVVIYGVSSDTAETQAAFRDKYTLPFTLIADTDKSVAKAFGKNRWSRQAYLFVDGRVAWRDLSAATAHQATEALAAIDSLNAQN